jgi:hypothetical protein
MKPTLDILNEMGLGHKNFDPPKTHGWKDERDDLQGYFDFPS